MFQVGGRCLCGTLTRGDLQPDTPIYFRWIDIGVVGGWLEQG